MPDIRIKEWGKLQYSCPKATLLAFRHVEETYDFSTTPDEISSLRTHVLRPWQEERQLALFCYGMSTIHTSEIHYWFGEGADYDGIALCKDGFVPIQLKELSPERLGNPRELEEELSKLKNKYSGGDLVVAFYLNRAIKGFNWTKIVVPELDIAELWFFGALTPEQDRWFLIGNMLNDPQGFEFDYPKNTTDSDRSVLFGSEIAPG